MTAMAKTPIIDRFSFIQNRIPKSSFEIAMKAVMSRYSVLIDDYRKFAALFPPMPQRLAEGEA